MTCVRILKVLQARHFFEIPSFLPYSYSKGSVKYVSLVRVVNAKNQLPILKASLSLIFAMFFLEFMPLFTIHIWYVCTTKRNV